MKRVLVTGADGMLGVDLCKVFAEKYEVYPTDVGQLDVREYDRVVEMIGRTEPEIIVHLAAMTDVDSCEREPDLAYRANTVGTQNMVLAANLCNAVIVYLSTGSVYGGAKEMPYTEYDEPAPRSVYSKSKLEGEKWVVSMARRFFIVTAGWMFGGGTLDKKFVGKILELSKVKKEIKVVNDKFGSPTYTLDLSRGILELLEWGRYGKYHVANQGCCTRYEIAKKILSVTGNRGCILRPVTSEDFPLAAPRPRMEAISNYNLKLLKKDMMRGWEEALEEYLHRIAALEKREENARSV
jgi:dTDP-4-dehydrorhamnose reductase